MQLFTKGTPRWIVMVIDLSIALFSLFFAYIIRFDFSSRSLELINEFEVLSNSILVFVGIKYLVFTIFGVHKGLVRYTSTEDMKRIFFALLTSLSLLLVFGFLKNNLFGTPYLLPTSILIMEFMISFFLMVVLRFAAKSVFNERLKQVNNDSSGRKSQNVLIYGAGVSGMITKRSIQRDTNNNYNLIGFIDDNSKIASTRLEGVKVFSSTKLESLIHEENVQLVIIAIQQPNEENRRKVVETCLKYNVKIRKVPSTKSWINGEFSSKQISKIKIEDLLGRKAIQLDVNKINHQIEDKVVLVTGAAGSIGSGLVKQLANFPVKKIILLDQAESAIYDLHNDLLRDQIEVPIEIVIGDIRSYERMQNVFNTFKPAFVFHAAAYKHVPLMEDNPSEAILTNVKGTKNLVDLSLQYQVEKFVMISTDKAVNPTNVMGASKRIAEIYAQKSNEKQITKFVTTRFGNVLGSNGSVIPLFQKQIDLGGPITVTDPNVTRFFMTIPEACQLVLEAGMMGEGGEIFVFDMGESVKIIDLAKKMIQLNGLELDKDIEIKFSGLRPGEKLYEELLANDENTIPTHHPQILKAKVRVEDEVQLNRIDELITLFNHQKNIDIVSKMKEIVPEFKSNNSIFEQLDKA